MNAVARLKEARQNLSVSEGVATASAFTPVGGGLIGAITMLGKVGSAVDANSKHNTVAQAEAELVNAQAILSNTPYQIEVPRRFTATYPIYMVHAQSKLLCSIKAFDLTSCRLLGTEVIKASHEVKDKYIKGNDRMNIPNDPLEVPSEEEFENTSLSNASNDIRTFLSSSMSKHGERFINKMEKMKNDGDKNKMIESCVYYILSYPNKSTFTSKAITYLNESLSKESKFIDLDKGLHGFKKMTSESYDFR